jgi:hypothetical protein
LKNIVDTLWDKIPKYPKDHIYHGLGHRPHVALKGYLSAGCLSMEHPVDYLYEQYLKLK